MNTILLALAQLLTFPICKGQRGNFDMLLFHSNNINFNFDEDKVTGGGAARALYVLNKYRSEWKRRNGTPMLYLNAGDNFSFARSYTVNSSEIIADYLNVMKPDAICLGNNDLNVGLHSLKQFLYRLTAPVLVSNVEFANWTGLGDRVGDSRVFKLGNRTVGVVGATISNAPIPFLPKGVSIGDEIEAIRKESEILHKDGVNIIIGLIHSNCATDWTIARVVEHVDVIVAGRRTSCNRNGPMKFVEAFRREDGRYIPIVHEAGHLRYLGKIKLKFDNDGNLITFTSDPVLLHKKIPQALEAVKVDRRSKREASRDTLGKSRTALSSECSTKECNYGNLVADAMVEYRAEVSDQEHDKYWTTYPIAIVSSGIFRKSILRGGVVSTPNIHSTILSDDTLALMSIKGSKLQEAILETTEWYGYANGFFPQFSGLRVTLNMSREGSKRIRRIAARCGKCDVPSYTDVLPDEYYRVIVNKKMFKEIPSFKRSAEVGYILVTLEVLVSKYIKKYKVVTPEVQDRLVVFNGSNRFVIDSIHLHTVLGVMFIVIFMYK